MLSQVVLEFCIYEYRLQSYAAGLLDLLLTSVFSAITDWGVIVDPGYLVISQDLDRSGAGWGGGVVLSKNAFSIQLRHCLLIICQDGSDHFTTIKEWSRVTTAGGWGSGRAAVTSQDLDRSGAGGDTDVLLSIIEGSSWQHDGLFIIWEDDWLVHQSHHQNHKQSWQLMTVAAAALCLTHFCLSLFAELNVGGSRPHLRGQHSPGFSLNLSIDLNLQTNYSRVKALLFHHFYKLQKIKNVKHFLVQASKLET